MTASVDTFVERDIVDTLRRASEQRTTLTVEEILDRLRLSALTPEPNPDPITKTPDPNFNSNQSPQL
jgi:hypothetical protein